jgi:hypothetical protein
LENHPENFKKNVVPLGWVLNKGYKKSYLQVKCKATDYKIFNLTFKKTKHNAISLRYIDFNSKSNGLIFKSCIK